MGWSTETKSGGTVRFSVFELNVRSGELCKRGVRLPIQGRPVQLLAILVENTGEIVTREELRNRLWPADTFVDFDHGLHNAIARLREVLGDSADTPRFIETLPRRGYRFIAPIQSSVSGDIAPAAGEATASATKPAMPFRRPLIASLALLFSAFAAAGAWFYNRSNRAPQPPAIRSLVVLPLASLSGDASQDYFAEGMTDELITELAKIRKLRVISRTTAMQYGGSKKSLREIGKELNVDAVLEGSVQRSGGQVRIAVQLIRAADDTDLWADSYDRDLRDVLALESEVARGIAKQIQVELTPEEQARLAAAEQVDPEAFRLYVRGLYYLDQRTREGASTGRKYFQQAIEKDPKFARAYVGLALRHDLSREFQLAKGPARKALELDPSLSSAHAALAYTAYRGDWDFVAAGQEFQRAIELGPLDSWALDMHAAYLESLGRNEEAVAEQRRSLEVDPLSPLFNENLGLLFADAGRYKEAILQAKTALEIDPNYSYAHLALGMMYAQQGQYENAAAEYRRVGNELGDYSLPLVTAHLYASEGRRAEALRLLGQVRPSKSDSLYGVKYFVAMVYTILGDKDRAFAWLEEAYREHDPDLLELKVEPDFKPLHSDPRFQDLLRRVGLPQ